MQLEEILISMKVLENIGVYHNSSTSEVYSYVIGFIAQKIYETLWE